MAADEIGPTQPLSPGLPIDPSADDHRQKPDTPPRDKPTAEEKKPPPKRRPPENLIDEYV
ncbi:hypothetical protein [Methylophaga sp. OBS3]|uniref:hypothetical protein n=1 Tax=Methylophaga sp. OBS3 TaxID=2991934 RepID=UPI002256D471|nr:hypothetical protein [Methylophaga sp. OBS3]MCX4188678.1 hypothetical protein [Methylophaga sp. OBS3]